MNKIGRIRIKDLDSSLSTKGGRILEIKVGSHSFQTPTRPFSVSEITAKSYLGYRGEIKSDIAALPVDFSGNRKELFLKNNGSLHNAERLLQSHSDASYNIPSVPVFQLDPFGSGDREAFKIAFEMQRYIEGIDLLSMPCMDAGKKDFERAVKDWIKSSEENGFGTAVQLFLDDDVTSFSEKLDILSPYTQSGAVQMISIQYALPSKHRQQLAALWSRREKLNAVINCIGARPQNSEVTKGLVADEEKELLQNGFDMITKKKNTINSKYLGFLKTQPPISSFEDIDNFKLSVHSASAGIKNQAWNTMKHPPECRCSVCRGDDRDRLIERFGYLDNEEISKSGLRYFSVLHDHQSDMIELEIFRKYTRTEGTKEYDQRIDDNLSLLKSAF